MIVLRVPFVSRVRFLMIDCSYSMGHSSFRIPTGCSFLLRFCRLTSGLRVCGGKCCFYLTTIMKHSRQLHDIVFDPIFQRTSMYVQLVALSMNPMILKPLEVSWNRSIVYPKSFMFSIRKSHGNHGLPLRWWPEVAQRCHQRLAQRPQTLPEALSGTCDSCG